MTTNGRRAAAPVRAPRDATVPSVLAVHQRPEERASIGRALDEQGHAVRDATTTAEALEALRTLPIDLVFVGSGAESPRGALGLLSTLKAHAPDVDVVFVTRTGSISAAVDAVKRGAADYLTLPLDRDRLQTLLSIARHRHAIAAGSVADGAADGAAGAPEASRHFVAQSAVMQQLLVNVAKLAMSRSPVLVTGESGTGKELVARLLHDRGPRRRTPFVPVNCGAIPETLIESELFGHSRGAFTGAISERTGLLAEAHGGVAFLDEIGEMPLPMQVRLLRFLQDGEVRLVGRSAIRHVDVRVVAATNRSLEDEVAQGRFREDLFYRIAVLRLHVPPLRQRVDDIRVLALQHLLRVTERDRLDARGFTDGALARLDVYRWPGNVRELHSVVERAAHSAESPLIAEADLPEAVRHAEPAATTESEPDDPARARLRSVMDQCCWNHRRAAATLGISRTTLWRRLRALGLHSGRGSWNRSFQA